MIDQFSVLPHLIANGLAIPIGWDREPSGRSAGLRPFPMLIRLVSSAPLRHEHP